MAEFKIEYLVAKKSKTKGVSWYIQPSKALRDAGWKGYPLGKIDRAAAIHAAEAFKARVDLWRATGEAAEGVNAPIKTYVARDTVAALIARYRREYMNANGPDGTPNVATKTKESYATALKRIDMWAGKHPLAYVTPARVRALRDAMMNKKGPGYIGHAPALNTLKMLRQLFAFAISVDLIPKNSNPATDFDLGAPAPRKTVWKQSHDSAFDVSARHLGYPSMALARELGLYTAQREGDLIRFNEHAYSAIELFDPGQIDRLGDDHGVVRGWVLEYQHKTKMPLEIAFDRPLRAKVEAALRSNRARDRSATPQRLTSHVIINDKTGLPWKKREFIATVQRILDHAATASNQADMRDLTWHDLRRTRVVRLRRQRVPKEQIAALTGTSDQTISAMLKAYGPIDGTMTAGTIIASLDADEAQAKAVTDKIANGTR